MGTCSATLSNGRSTRPAESFSEQQLLERSVQWLAEHPQAWDRPDAREDAARAGHWLSVLGLDAVSQAACRLYPAAPRSATSAEAVRKAWGEEMAMLWQGLDRLSSVSGVVQEANQAEALRRMLLALSEDLRVVLIRLAQHLVRLERAVKAPAQSDARHLGEETLRVHAPLANRLGIWQLKWALEDHAFRLSDPERYRQIAGWLDERRSEREAFVAKTQAHLLQLMASAGLAAEVSGRPKHLYSIFNKMRNKGLAFDALRDLRAFRVLVAEQQACYEALAVVHAAFTPMDDEFDDYISRPKPNGYQSLHTVVIDDEGRPFEIQIRTREMHLRAEYGVAAHWKYKEAGGSVATAGQGYEAQIQWLRQMLAWGENVGQVRLSGDRIYVLTPRAKIIELPVGATPLDFAYVLHTELGHRCRGAKVDGQIVPLQTPLQTGQTVELLTTKIGAPSRDWMLAEAGYLVSARARAKVRAWFHAQEEAPRESKDSRESRESREAKEAPEAREHRLPALRAAAPAKSRVLVVGVDRLLTSMAKCCRPLPPDPIVGFVTRGKGVSIHRQGCLSALRLEREHPDRMIETSWGDASQIEGRYEAAVRVLADARDSLLKEVTDGLVREKVPILRLASQRGPAELVIRMEIQLTNRDALDRVLTLLRGLGGVRSAVRE
ncbi:MAG: pyrophosphokinae [Pseudomonadota bacterium]